MTNPQVQEEILRILYYWMPTGIAGFRIDAVPHIVQDKGGVEHQGDPYELLNVWRKVIQMHDSEGVLIGEADVDPKKYPRFLEDGRLTALFNFYLNNNLFLALAQGTATAMVKALEQFPLMDGNYLTFLRNHDELDLGVLSEADRHVVYEAFAPSLSMRIYNRGIRRRLPPMLNNDSEHLILAFSILFSLPGVPVLRYGEEIGMGDDLNLPERRSVRTAMQWSEDRNAGFSEITPQALQYALIREGEYGYPQLNVKSQLSQQDSILNRIKELIRLRKKMKDWFVYGLFKVWPIEDESLLCLSYEKENGYLIWVHNFSNEQAVMYWPPIGQSVNGASTEVTLPRYGFTCMLVENGVITKLGGS